MAGMYLLANLFLACIASKSRHKVDNLLKTFEKIFSATKSIQCYLCIPPPGTDVPYDFCAKENLQNRVDDEDALIQNCDAKVTRCRYCTTINANQQKGTSSSFYIPEDCKGGENLQQSFVHYTRSLCLLQRPDGNLYNLASTWYQMWNILCIHSIWLQYFTVIYSVIDLIKLISLFWLNFLWSKTSRVLYSYWLLIPVCLE